MKLSVAMCTYNGEVYIKKQLDSILEQDVPVHQIIICDDGSTDTTRSILKEYQSKNPGLIRIVENEKNLGSNKNFEQAITLCDGDYIFLSDQDDLWDTQKTKKTLAVFEENPTAEGVFSDAILIDGEGKTIVDNFSLWDSVYFFESKIKKTSDLYHLIVYRGNFMTGATFCMKKEVKEFCSPFKTTSGFLHDEWLAFVLSSRNTLFYSKEKLLFYRIHDSQQVGVGTISNSAKKTKSKAIDFEKLLDFNQIHTFSDYKMITRKCFSQYEKYKLIIDHYGNNATINSVKEKLLESYVKFDAEMKKNYPIRYFFRKLKDQKKGKRQLN